MRLHSILAIIGVAVGCGSESEAEAPFPDELVGTISIIEYDGAGDWGDFAAHFEARTQPDLPLVDDLRCRVLRQPCLGNVGACDSSPGVGIGTLRVRGLHSPVDVEPADQGSYHANVSRDAFADDAEIAVEADEAVELSLTTRGVAPMESSLAGTSLPPFGDAPVAFQWTPGDDGARVRLTLNVASMCHPDADWLMLECDVPDRGSVTVSDNVLSVLPAGYMGCGATLTRYRSERVVVDGNEFELMVGNADSFDLFDIF